jgi:hypothetical protein
MDAYSIMLAGREDHAEYLREAQAARRFLTAQRAGKMPALLRALLLIFM